MIIRVVRGLLLPGQDAAFIAYVRQLFESALDDVDGLVQLEVGRIVEGNQVRVLATSLWRDFDALDSFYAGDLQEARLLDPEHEFFESATVEHFEHVGTVSSEAATEAN